MPPTWRMILRQIRRRPLNTSFSVIGIAMAAGIYNTARIRLSGRDRELTTAQTESDQYNPVVMLLTFFQVQL